MTSALCSTSATISSLLLNRSADLLHTRHQRSINDLERRIRLQRFVQIRNQAFLRSFNNIGAKRSSKVRFEIFSFFSTFFSRK